MSAFRVKLGANDLKCVDVPLNPTHLVRILQVRLLLVRPVPKNKLLGITVLFGKLFHHHHHVHHHFAALIPTAFTPTSTPTTSIRTTTTYCLIDKQI